MLKSVRESSSFHSHHLVKVRTLDSDEKVALFYTTLPSFKILKTVFDHVVTTLQVEG